MPERIDIPIHKTMLHELNKLPLIQHVTRKHLSFSCISLGKDALVQRLDKELVRRVEKFLPALA